MIQFLFGVLVLLLSSISFAQTAIPEPERAPLNGISLSLGFPHPIFLDYNRRFAPKFTAALGLGGLSLNLPSQGVDQMKVGVGAFDLRGRYHPWAGSFFLGGILGVQSLSAQGVEAIPVGNQLINTTVKLTVQGTYFTPHLGWLWIFRSGFTLGFEFGLQVPFNPKSNLTIETTDSTVNGALDLVQATPQYQNLEKKITDAANLIGRIKLPYATLLRIGWFF